MTAPDELAQRRSRVAQPDSHRSRAAYGSVREVVADASQVVSDLESIAAGQLLVPWEDLDFTVRRLRRLLAGVSVAVERTEAQS